MQLTQNHRFKTGKYANETYFSVWEKNPDYFYWMASNYGTFWTEVVKQLELRDAQRIKDGQRKPIKFPSIEQVKQVFSLNPICGFDMSDYICEIYQACPDIYKSAYFESLLLRNKIKLT